MKEVKVIIWGLGAMGGGMADMLLKDVYKRQACMCWWMRIRIGAVRKSAMT